MLHVIPENDLKPHRAEVSCGCYPLVEKIEGGSEDIVAHNAWDCREPYERMSFRGKPGKGWVLIPVDD